jgi:hypothetical protein
MLADTDDGRAFFEWKGREIEITEIDANSFDDT